MTEKEAKEKWCPYAQMQTGHVALGNRCADGSVMNGAFCIGSKCMMWRWHMRYESRDWAGKDFEKMQRELLRKGGWVEQLNAMDPSGMVALPSDSGYCGLAGKP